MSNDTAKAIQAALRKEGMLEILPVEGAIPPAFDLHSSSAAFTIRLSRESLSLLLWDWLALTAPALPQALAALRTQKEARSGGESVRASAGATEEAEEWRGGGV